MDVGKIVQLTTFTKEEREEFRRKELEKILKKTMVKKLPFLR